jgi:deoxyribodipyrimidine photolyase-related protein
MTAACHTLRLVLGDQLNPGHSWFAQMDSQVVYVLMEVRQETDYVLHHAQKILAIFAAMRDFARQLRAAGHRVRYVALTTPATASPSPTTWPPWPRTIVRQAVQWQQPDEWRLDAQLRDWAATQPLACEAVDSEHFLTARGDLAALIHGPPPVADGALLPPHAPPPPACCWTRHGKPEGGQWNFDHDNRKPWPGTPPEPADWRPQHDHSALWAMIERAGVASFGAPQAAALRWPLNRAEALACLDAFITTALPHFGDYEDAWPPRRRACSTRCCRLR